MGLFLLILLFAVIYALGWSITAMLKVRRNRVWWWFVISWVVWAVCWLGYWPLISGSEQYQIGDFRLTLEILWLNSLLISVQHILLIVSIIVLCCKK